MPQAAVLILATALLSGVSYGAENYELDIFGSLDVENLWYPQNGAYAEQRAYATGFVAKPKLFLTDYDGSWSIQIAPFFRLDTADSQRTHADLREAYFLVFGEIGDGEWEMRLGVDRVFWGVTESQHLVDIINQTDLVENPNRESKLGQPMAHLTWSTERGIMEFFALTYHRARTFPGVHGRLRSSILIDDEHIEYESAAGEWHVDLAARYSNSFGPFDVGLSVFDGTNRDPVFMPNLDADGTLSLVQHYEQIRQYSMDGQLTIESWLFKLEALRREGASNLMGAKEDYTAFVLGGEYTFNSVLGSAADFGLLAEWNYDLRQEREHSSTEFQNDMFLAVRLALNDTQSTNLIAGILADMDYSTRTLSMVLKRRISDQWSLNLETIVFMDVDEKDIIYTTRRDSFIALNLTYNF
ncbi:MAG: hypothetical protein OXC84_07375 [Gammaproteobacteria bacterium]|nr:hypothetical protein [Gammaproteobacteria bacterium]